MNLFDEIYIRNIYKRNNVRNQGELEDLLNILFRNWFPYQSGKAEEVDFVCNLGSARYYIQSAYSLPDEAKRTQEIRPFRKIDDSFKKIVVTKDIIAPYYDEYGILTMNIYDFLLNPRSLEQ